MHPPTDPVTPPRRAQFCVLLFGTLLLLHLWCMGRGWSDSILDGHEFRQVQTAITAHYIRQDGLRLDYETPILGPPWSIPMELPLYQATVALLSRATALPLEQAGRLVAAAFFYAALAGGFLVLRRWLPSRTERLLPLTFILSCPIYLFYSRCFLIESTALCLGVWFLWAYLRWCERPGPVRLGAVWALGSLAATVKITTFGVFALPAAAATAAAMWSAAAAPDRNLRAALRHAALGLLAIAPPLVAGAAWVVHSDTVKAANPLAGFLLSTSLREFNLGTLAQRCSGEFWLGICRQIGHSLLGEGAAFLVAVAAFATPPPLRHRALACAFFFAGGFLAFANLYYVHDYYFYANAAFLMTGAGLVAVGLLRNHKLPLPTFAAATLLALGSQYALFEHSYAGFYRRPNPPPPPLAALVRAALPAQDVVLVFGRDWSGQIAYYSQRRAIMIPDRMMNDITVLDRSLAALGSRRIGAVVMDGPSCNTPYFVRSRLDHLQEDLRPFAKSDSMMLYLRRDLLPAAQTAATALALPDVQLTTLAPPPAAPLHDLQTPEWQSRLSGFAPALYAVRSSFAPGILRLDGLTVLNTHAPSDLYLVPPAGSRSIEVECGILPSAYTQGNETDGVVFEIYEECAGTPRRLLARRAVDPVGTPADRTTIHLHAEQDRPFEGVLVCRVDPGPQGNVNCDWAYWKSFSFH